MRVEMLCTWVCGIAGSIVVIGAAIGVAGSLAWWGWSWRKKTGLNWKKAAAAEDRASERRNRRVVHFGTADPAQARVSVSPRAAEAFRTMPVYQSPLCDTESETIS